MTRVRVAPEDVDALADSFTGSALPALREIAGYAGHSLAVDRESGDSQAVTFWESRAALDASEEAAGGIRTTTVAAAGGSVVTVDRFEIVLMERFTAPVAPSYLRVTRGVADPGKLDAITQDMRDNSVPVCRGLAGARALVLGVDRSSGRFAITSVWESPEAREASLGTIGPLRDRLVADHGISDPETSTYEVRSVEFVGAGARTG